MDLAVAKCCALFEGNQIPDVCSDNIELIEKFLLRAPDSVMEEYVDRVIQFFVKALDSENQFNSGDVQHKIWLLRVLRFFRPQTLNSDRSRKLERIANMYLDSWRSRSKAYVWLVDHILTTPTSSEQLLQRLLKWTVDYLSRLEQADWSKQNPLFDEDLYTIMCSLQPLIKIEDDSLRELKDSLVENILEFCRYNILQCYYHNCARIIAKGMRVCAKIIEQRRFVSGAARAKVEEIRKAWELPEMKDLCCLRVYQNYLVLYSAVICAGGYSVFPEGVVGEILNNLGILAHGPFARSKRLEKYLRAVEKWVMGSRQCDPAVLTKIWPLIGNVHCHRKTVKASFDIIHLLFVGGKARLRPLEMMDQLVSVLELMKIELESIHTETCPKQKFEAKSWSKANVRAMRLISAALDRVRTEDGQRFDIIVPLLERLCKYVSSLLDWSFEAVSQTTGIGADSSAATPANGPEWVRSQCRAKVPKIFRLFVEILSVLPPMLLNYLLSVSLIEFLRKTPSLWQFQELTKGLKQPFIFYRCFFQTVTRNFDELFFPPAERGFLLRLTMRMFREAMTFGDAVTPMNVREEEFDAVCKDVYRFILLVLSSKQYKLLGLLSSMLDLVFKLLRGQQQQRLPPSWQQQQARLSYLVQQCGFSMPIVLQALSDEPELETIVSSLALSLYPFCQHSDDNEQWAQLFLPVCELDSEVRKIIQTLRDVTDNFSPAWTSRLKERVRSRFITAVISLISKLPPESRAMFGGSLDSVPDLTTRISLDIHEQKHKIQTVRINGTVICVDPFFEAVSTKISVDTNDLTTIAECMCQLIEKNNFVTATTDKLTCQIAEFLSRKNPDVFRGCMEMMVTDNGKFTLLFLQYRYLRDCLEAIQSLERKPEFVVNLCGVCYNKKTAKHAVELLGILIDDVPNGDDFVRVVSSIIHASQFEYKHVQEILKKCVFERPHLGEDMDVVTKLCEHCTSMATTCFSVHVRKTALKVLKFFADRYGIVTLSEVRRQVLETLPARLSARLGSRYPLCLKFEFIFTSRFTDVQNPLARIEELIEFLRCVFRTSKLVVVSREVQRLFKSVKCQDPNMTQYITVKFVLKAIAKLLAVVSDQEKARTVWDNLLMLIDEKIRQFVRYFIHLLKKEARVSHPTYLSLPSRFFGHCQERVKRGDSSPEEVMILRFICEQLNDATLHRAFVEYLQAVLRCSERLKDPFILKQVMKFTVVLRQQDCHDMRELVRGALDRFVFKPFVPKAGYIQYLANAFPDIVCQQIVERFKTNWSVSSFVAIARVFMLKGIKEFKRYVADALCRNFGVIGAFLQERSEEDLILVRSFVLSTMAALWEMDEDENDIPTLLRVSVQTLQLFFQNRPPVLPGFTPSVFGNALRVFLPLKYAHAFDEDPELLEIFRDNLATKFLTCVDDQGRCVFLHPLFPRRFLQFMLLLSPENCENVYSALEAVQCNMSSSILLNQLLGDYYYVWNVEKTVKAGFRDYPSFPLFESMLLHYSGCLLGAGKRMVLSDVSDIVIWAFNSFVHWLCLRHEVSKVQAVESMRRFLQILAYLEPGEENLDILGKFKNSAPNLLGHMPYTLKASSLCFSTLAGSNRIDRSMSSVYQFILGYATKMLTRRETKNSVHRFDRFVKSMPYVFREVKHEKLKQEIATTVLDVLLQTSLKVLGCESRTTNGGTIPQAIEEYMKCVNLTVINQDLVLKLRKKLRKAVREGEQDRNRTRFKFCCQLITSLATVLFNPKDPLKFPIYLSPQSFLLTEHLTREFQKLYKNALRAIYLAGGSMRVGKFITDAVFAVLSAKLRDVPQPLETPFASVAEWLKLFPRDRRPLGLEILLKALKPSTALDLYMEISSLKQPLHPEALMLLQETITKHFPETVRSCSEIPATRIMFLTQSKDLVMSCWEFPWRDIVEESHLAAFALLMLPQSISEHIWRFSTKHVKNMVIRTLNSNAVPYGFRRFAEYYVQSFPSSSLAECFTTTMVPNALPFPSSELFVNMSFLDQCNLCEDALGILWDRYRYLRDAVGFHQITNYKAAWFYYLREMDNHPDDVYFHCLLKLRSLSVNLSLPTTPDLADKVTFQQESSAPLVVLPFFQDFICQYDARPAGHRRHYGGHWTSFISTSYVPYFIHKALEGEARLYWQLMRRPTTDTNALMQRSNTLGMRSLDKQTMIASSLTWRLTYLDRFLQTDQDIKVQQQQQESLSRNKLMLVKMLANAGDVSRALVLLRGASDRPEVRPFRVTELNIVRVFPFLKTVGSQFARFHSDAFLLVRRYQDARMKSIAYSGQNRTAAWPWLQFIVQFVNRTGCQFSKQDIMEKMIAEMTEPSSSSKLDLYIALALNLLRQDESLSDIFWKPIRPNECSPLFREAWFRWLPIFFSVCGHIPELACSTMIKWDPVHFVLLHNQAQLQKRTTNVPELPAALRQGEGLAEVYAAFQWVHSQEIQEAAASFERKVIAHSRLYESLGRNIRPRSDDALKGFDVDELEHFCTENPPFFKANFEGPLYSATAGLRFPFSSAIFRLQLDAPGDREAQVVMTTMRGELRLCNLVSPLVYRLSFRERILINCLARHVEKEPSSRSRTCFMRYPESYRIHKALMLVMVPSTVCGVHELMRPFNLPQLLGSSKSRVEDDDHSPAAQVEKRTRQLPNDVLVRWIIDATENGKIDFLVMRQSLANYFACYSFLRFIFCASYDFIPSFMFYNNRQQMIIPGFLSEEGRWSVVYPPLTDQILGLFPSFVLRGSCSTTWHTLANTMSKRADVVKVYLRAILPRQMATSAPEAIVKRTIRASTNTTVDTDKCETNFAFAVFDHLIDTANNAVRAQMDMIAWV